MNAAGLDGSLLLPHQSSEAQMLETTVCSLRQTLERMRPSGFTLDGSSMACRCLAGVRLLARSSQSFDSVCTLKKARRRRGVGVISAPVIGLVYTGRLVRTALCARPRHKSTPTPALYPTVSSQLLSLVPLLY